MHNSFITLLNLLFLYQPKSAVSQLEYGLKYVDHYKCSFKKFGGRGGLYSDPNQSFLEFLAKLAFIEVLFKPLGFVDSWISPSPSSRSH